MKATEDEHRASAEATDLPEAARREIAAHHRQYAEDPETAHWWDPGVIGVPGGAVAIVASKGGTAFHPAWYHNLLAEPACEVQIGTWRGRARARTVHGAERAAWWARITREQPMQLEYAASTRREIPVVVLDAEGEFEADGVTRFPAVAWAGREVLG